jgi:hypothetical protein
MKFETENPKLVMLIGVALAAALVLIGVKFAPAQLGWFTTVAGLTLGSVGVTVKDKS